MQTILGSNGQIAIELAKELYKNYTKDIQLVSRNPKKINETDEIYSANLLDAQATQEAIAGSEIVYFTAGLPMNSDLWEEQFLLMMQNTIAACRQHNVKLVFFDNTYMYSKTEKIQTEENPFVYKGRKSIVRAKMADLLQTEINQGNITAVICRAPEFYGPAKTQSITNSFIFQAIKRQKKLRVPLKDNKLRTLIWTPDASRATALIGNTPEAYQQTWHLPCDDNRLTYQQFIALTSEIYQKKFEYDVISSLAFKFTSYFKENVKELQELLPRYGYDNIFISDKFQKRFPEFRITTYREGITEIWNESKRK